MVIFRFGRNRFNVPSGQILLLVALFFLPVLSPSLFGWMSGLLAVPVCCLLQVNGEETGKKILYFSLVATGVGAFLLQRLEFFLFLLTLVPLGFALHRGIAIKEPAATSGGKGVAILGLTWLCFWGIYGAVTGVNPYNQLLQVIDLGFQQTLELYGSKEAGLPPEVLLNLTSVTNAMREVFPRMLPGLLMTMVITTVWISIVLINSLTGRLTETVPWGSYSTWKLPELLVCLPIVGIALLVFGKGIFQDGGGWLTMAAVLLYFFQGLAVFISLLERWRVPYFVRIMLYAVLIIQSYGLILLAILGLSDVWIDFRKQKSNNAR